MWSCTFATHDISKRRAEGINAGRVRQCGRRSVERHAFCLCSDVALSPETHRRESAWVPLQVEFRTMKLKGRKTPFAPSLSVTILSSEVSQISTFPKFMEELIMPFKRAQVPSQREILSLAEDWGKVVARRAFGDEGPDLDLNFDAIEAVAFQAAQAVIKGTIQQSLSQQMRKLGETQSCPQCRRVCPVETEPRELIVRGATVQYDEPKCHCPTCRRDFFPSPSRVAT